MIEIAVFVLAILGIALNLAFSSAMLQPDWALALLLASLLAHRHNWIWVLPGILIHDLGLHWSFWASFPVIAIIPFAMIYLDRRLGPGLPQRLLLMLIATMAPMRQGWGLQACLLTLCLCLPVWHLLTSQYAQRTA
jgi:hypothetical protein